MFIIYCFITIKRPCFAGLRTTIRQIHVSKDFNASLTRGNLDEIETNESPRAAQPTTPRACILHLTPGSHHLGTLQYLESVVYKLFRKIISDRSDLSEYIKPMRVGQNSHGMLNIVQGTSSAIEPQSSSITHLETTHPWTTRKRKSDELATAAAIRNL